MTTTENVTTWRDLADDLTDEQFGRLDAAAWMADEERLDIARHYVLTNQLQTTLAHVPAPGGACRMGKWVHDGESVARIIYGQDWQSATVAVRIIGQQDSTGITVMGVEVRDRNDDLMTAGGARELAAALLEAADELDKLNGDAPPFV